VGAIVVQTHGQAHIPVEAVAHFWQGTRYSPNGFYPSATLTSGT